ncbi:hypothetical protein ACFY2R_18085 [Micromonospora olivasterospora]|uniref:hypothetical protein n=1 Tax=Micromonospora olivasterospora TaxID=1880 RepID=UPI00119E08DE|nr:hypothetical protein [Micromonospora olivasterospora]
MTKSRARRQAAADATYRRALNLPTNGELPKQLGATGAGSTSGAGKPSRKPRPKKTTGKTAATAGKRRSAGAQPRAKQTTGVAASFAGTCVTCGRGYRAGARLGKVTEGWAHVACAEAVRERDRILHGETFAARKPSDWRLGKGPSSSRLTR